MVREHIWLVIATHRVLNWYRQGGHECTDVLVAESDLVFQGSSGVWILGLHMCGDAFCAGPRQQDFASVTYTVVVHGGALG